MKENMSIVASRSRIIIYWVCAALVACQLGAVGVGDISRPISLVEGMDAPVCFCVIHDIWKMLGAIAIFILHLPCLKEWMYAGGFLDLTGASAEHLAAGNSVIKLIGPFLFTFFLIISWVFRPQDHRVLM